MQTLLIIQRTQLYYGYCTIFLKQNREKIFCRNHKTFMCNFRAIFLWFSADFSAQFARNLRKLRAILAHFQRNFRANFAFFPCDFLQGLDSSNTIIIMTLHRSIRYADAAYCYRWNGVVCMSVCQLLW